MLILTRKIDQAIVIQDNILVRVLGIERDRVKLGITANDEIVILREELTKNDGGNGRDSHAAVEHRPGNGSPRRP